MICLKGTKNWGGGTTQGGIEEGWLVAQHVCSESKLVVVVAKKFSLLFCCATRRVP